MLPLPGWCTGKLTLNFDLWPLLTVYVWSLCHDDRFKDVRQKLLTTAREKEKQWGWSLLVVCLTQSFAFMCACVYVCISFGWLSNWSLSTKLKCVGYSLFWQCKVFLSYRSYLCAALCSFPWVCLPYGYPPWPTWHRSYRDHIEVDWSS